MNIFILINFLVIIFLTGENLLAQVNWVKHSGPIMTKNDTSWYVYIFQPCVLYNADSSRYEMWFGGTYQADRPYHIGFATSEDGIKWDVYKEPVLSPSTGEWDSFTVEWPWVLRENGTYKMWYGGGSVHYGDKVGFATSADGINWTKDTLSNPVFKAGDKPWEERAVGGVFVEKIDNKYRMWYGGYTDNLIASIGYALSYDGIFWERDTINNPVLKPGLTWERNAGIPRVHFIEGQFYIWYSGRLLANVETIHTGLAISTDGLNWNKFGDPVLSPSPNEWDSYYIEGGSILFINDTTLYFWYGGGGNYAGSFRLQIGLAVSHYSKPVTIKQTPTEFLLNHNTPNPLIRQKAKHIQFHTYCNLWK